ncbi:hypothetical protein BS636_04565 [Acinetobacter sp. LoGeW2-3]|nr:hypothetical protein BS636_04565 [Acinetobacter sp. LoGeW2-3]
MIFASHQDLFRRFISINSVIFTHVYLPSQSIKKYISAAKNFLLFTDQTSQFNDTFSDYFLSKMLKIHNLYIVLIKQNILYFYYISMNYNYKLTQNYRIDITATFP